MYLTTESLSDGGSFINLGQLMGTDKFHSLIRGFLLNKDMSSDILSHSLEDNDNGNMNKINNVIEAILEEGKQEN